MHLVTFNIKDSINTLLKILTTLLKILEEQKECKKRARHPCMWKKWQVLKGNIEKKGHHVWEFEFIEMMART